jgi:hypothetical protein
MRDSNPLQIHALHDAATGIGLLKKITGSIFYNSLWQVDEISIYSLRPVVHEKETTVLSFQQDSTTAQGPGVA